MSDGEYFYCVPHGQDMHSDGECRAHCGELEMGSCPCRPSKPNHTHEDQDCDRCNNTPGSAECRDCELRESLRNNFTPRMPGTENNGARALEAGT